MDKLIYLTGEIESPFFLNEIDEFNSQFDEIIVVAYSGNKEKCKELSLKHRFKYYLLSDVSINKLMMKEFVKWRKKDFVKDELKKHRVVHVQGIKRIMYVYYYLVYCSKLHYVIDQTINNTDSYYVYSFWLSRPGFGTASFAQDRPINIKRLVSRTHRYDLYEEENSYGYLPFREYISKSLDTIYFSSIDTIDYFENKNYSSKQPKYKLSYLGTRECNRKVIDPNKKNIVIASCSYIIDRKRLDLIIKFVDCLSKLGYSIKWIHIGNGEKETSIKKMAESALEQDTYSFVGRLSDDEIYELYEKEDVDLFINLSDSEGIPVSILEALSMGIPVIARNVGGISDAIDDGINGILLDCKGSEDIETIIQKAAAKAGDLFMDKSRYSKVSENAYNKWEATFFGKNNAILVAKDIIDDTSIKEINR